MGSEGVKAVLASLEGKNVNKRIDTGVILVSQENIDMPEIQALIK